MSPAKVTTDASRIESLQSCTYTCLQAITLAECLVESCLKPSNFLIQRLVVLLRVFGADVTAGRENVPMLGDLFDRG